MGADGYVSGAQCFLESTLLVQMLPSDILQATGSHLQPENGITHEGICPFRHSSNTYMPALQKPNSLHKATWPR